MTSDYDYWNREYSHACSELWRERDLHTQTMRERDEAQEAAQDYHEAWQDAAVYWKDRVAKLADERDEARSLLHRLLELREVIWLENRHEESLLYKEWKQSYPWLKDNE